MKPLSSLLLQSGFQPLLPLGQQIPSSITRLTHLAIPGLCGATGIFSATYLAQGRRWMAGLTATLTGILTGFGELVATGLDVQRSRIPVAPVAGALALGAMGALAGGMGSLAARENEPPLWSRPIQRTVLIAGAGIFFRSTFVALTGEAPAFPIHPSDLFIDLVLGQMLYLFTIRVQSPFRVVSPFVNGEVEALKQDLQKRLEAREFAEALEITERLYGMHQGIGEMSGALLYLCRKRNLEIMLKRGGDATRSLGGIREILQSADSFPFSPLVLFAAAVSLEEPDERMKWIERSAARIHESGDNPDWEAIVRVVQADIIYSRGGREEAASFIQRAASVYKQRGHSEGEAKQHLGEALRTFLALGDERSTLDILRRLEILCQESGKMDLVAWLNELWGDIAMELGIFDSAEDAYRRAAEVYSSLDDTAGSVRLKAALHLARERQSRSSPDADLAKTPRS